MAKEISLSADDLEGSFLKFIRLNHKKISSMEGLRKDRTKIFTRLEEFYLTSLENNGPIARRLGELRSYGLLEKNDLIEFVRFKFIGEKIAQIGRKNSLGSLEFGKQILSLAEDPMGGVDGLDSQLKAYFLDLFNRELKRDQEARESKISLGRLETIGVDPILFISGIVERINWGTRSFLVREKIVESALERLGKEGEKLSKENLAREVRSFLDREDIDLPLDKLRQVISVLKLRNLKDYRPLNKTFTDLHQKTKNLSFKDEEDLMEYFYRDIDLGSTSLKNLDYYRLEASMGFEFKKGLLTTVHKIYRTYKNIDRELELKKLLGLARIENFYLYENLFRTYIDLYDDYPKFLRVLDSIEIITDYFLRELALWEDLGDITRLDLLDELMVFPRVYQPRFYRNDYRLNKDFSRYEYLLYNELFDYKTDKRLDLI